MAADCSNRLRTIAKCHAELERLQALLDSGHPDADGIQRGIEDWIHEEVIILSEMQVGTITQLTTKNGNGHGAIKAVKFEGGAQRSEFQPPYYLLEDCFLVATANRMRKGELAHGRDNYKQGGPEFVLETFNHMLAHLMALKEGDQTDNHMEAVCANALILAWHHENRPENFRLLRGDPCST